MSLLLRPEDRSEVEDEMLNYFNSLVFRCLVLGDSRNEKTSECRVRRPEMAKK